MSDLVNDEVVQAWVKAAMPDGATQIEVFSNIVEGENLSEFEIGLAMQATSRVLSTLAKDGVLDDSGRRGKKHVYKVPGQALAARGTKMEQLRAENERLKGRIAQLEDARDCVVVRNARLQEAIDAMKVPEKPVIFTDRQSLFIQDAEQN